MKRIGVAAVAVLAGCSNIGTAELNGDGGDVWAFERRVTGMVNDDLCATVTVSGGRHEVTTEVAGRGFAAVVPLSSGANDLTARCYAGNRSAPERWTVRLADRPHAVARATVDGARITLDADQSDRSPVAQARFAELTWTMRGGAVLGHGRVLTIDTPADDGRYVAELEIVDERGASDRAAVAFEVVGGVARATDAPPPWVHDAVVYGVFPFFFGARGLPDVTARLDELHDLGVTVVWLSPVTEAAAGDYGYAVTDHFAVRDDFGGADALAELVTAAHARGMHVVLDLVANHTSIDHPYLASRPDLYDRDDNGELTHYFDWVDLPNLDVEHPEVRAWLTEAFSSWVRAGIDGFRADVAWGVTDRAPGFWPRLRRELHRIEPDLVLIGESSARDPRSYDGFDLAYDWTDTVGEWAWRDAMDAASEPLLGAALAQETGGPVLRFLDNNDTGARFATRYGVARVPAAAAVLFTVPGVPALWTGSETGAALEPYDEGPPLSWDDPDGLVDVYRRLIAIHATLPDDFTLLAADDVLAYLRGDVLVIVDLAGAPVDVDLAITPELDAVLDGTLHDVFHDEDVPYNTPNGRLRLTLAADGVRIMN